MLTVLTAAVLLAVVLSVASGRAPRYAPVGYGTREGAYGGRVEPSAAEQAATLSATKSYRRLVVTATESFAASTASLVTTTSAGDLVDAWRDLFAAQGAYDVFRSDLAGGLGPAAPLDALVADQAAGSPPQGLHAIERDLARGDLTDAARVARQVASQSLLVEVGLFRTILTPSEICQRVAESLVWVVAQVIDSPQEVYAQRDVVDVRASAVAARAAVDGLLPLARLVTPADARDLATSVSSLGRAVARVPSDARDAQLSPSTWRSLAAAIDATLGPLARVGGDLAGFGTGRAYA
jgi:iron uptake system EfeUOB component EfeO/EfeM